MVVKSTKRIQRNVYKPIFGFNSIIIYLFTTLVINNYLHILMIYNLIIIENIDIFTKKTYKSYST